MTHRDRLLAEAETIQQSGYTGEGARERFDALIKEIDQIDQSTRSAEPSSAGISAAYAAHLEGLATSGAPNTHVVDTPRMGEPTVHPITTNVRQAAAARLDQLVRSGRFQPIRVEGSLWNEARLERLIEHYPINNVTEALRQLEALDAEADRLARELRDNAERALAQLERENDLSPAEMIYREANERTIAAAEYRNSDAGRTERLIAAQERTNELLERLVPRG